MDNELIRKNLHYRWQKYQEILRIKSELENTSRIHGKIHGCYSLPYFRKFRPEISCWRSCSKKNIGKMRQLNQDMDVVCNSPSSRPWLDSTRPRGESIQLLIKIPICHTPTDVWCNIVSNVSRFSYWRRLDRLWIIEKLNVRMERWTVQFLNNWTNCFLKVMSSIWHDKYAI